MSVAVSKVLPSSPSLRQVLTSPPWWIGNAGTEPPPASQVDFEVVGRIVPRHTCELLQAGELQHRHFPAQTVLRFRQPKLPELFFARDYVLRALGRWVRAQDQQEVAVQPGYWHR